MSCFGSICLGFFIALLAVTASQKLDQNILRKYYDAYNKSRTELIKMEEEMCVGGRVILNSHEEEANRIFKGYKMDDLQNTDVGGMHFYDAKDIIQKSTLYQLIRKMPKGANLNIHDHGSVSSDWIVQTLSYMPDFKICMDKEADFRPVFTFRREEGPTFVNCSLAQEIRKQNPLLDEELRKLTNLYYAREGNDILPSDKMWKLFCDMYDRMVDAVLYKPAFKAFHKRMLEELYEDNIMYAEIRTHFSELYDNTNKKYNLEDSVRILLKLVQKFKEKHTDFIGVKFIYKILRHGSEDDVRKELKTYLKLRSKYPDHIIGVDIVGWEDFGQPLHKFVEDFITMDLKHANFFFHAGETNLLGDSSDYNLFDAFMLLTKRIGQGFALWKHPYILKEITECQTPVEICPVSNQITSFIRDLRNHPGGFYIARNMSIVVGSDSPGFFGTTGLSTDFYYTILSLTSTKADLKTLKQLILNSIHFSDMTSNEKEQALALFAKKWEDFLFEIIKHNVNEK